MDETEGYRRQRMAELNAEKAERKTLEEKYGRVWDTQELQDEFEVKGFMAPFVVVSRKADGMIGSMEFQHYPRYYFNWKEDRK